MKKVLFTLAILCIVTTSCKSSPYPGTEEKPREEWTNWTDGQLVSIVNDSLAILKIHKYQKNTWYDLGVEGSNEEYEITDARTGLFLVNYRVKQKPLWGDTLNHNLRVADDYYKDSSVLVFDSNNNSFGFWKIGTNSIDFKKYKTFENCNSLYAGIDVAFKARPWINKNVLLIKPEDMLNVCSTLILNVETTQIEPFVFSEEHEWLSHCNDFSYIGSKVICIKRNETSYNFEFYINNVITDTLTYEYIQWHGISNWYGNYIKDSRYSGDGIFSTGDINKIDTVNFKFDETFKPIKVKYAGMGNYEYERYSAFQGLGNSFMYKAEDLIQTGN